MDIIKQAESVAHVRWDLYDCDVSNAKTEEPTGLSNAIFDEDDQDRRDFFGEILDAVMPTNTGGWTIAAVYECETVSSVETFVAVIWRIKSSDGAKTLIEFKAFLLQWDEEHDCYIVARNRKI